jgi:cytochrome c-type biogenesis protein CcmH
MTWVIAIGLALAAFAAAAFAFRLDRRGWSAFAAALALGLAGYALQASPGIPSSAAQPRVPDQELGSALIDARKAMIGDSDKSFNSKVLTADAYARQGRYADAAVILRGAVADNPKDGDAWLALGNALVEHADGLLTPPALYAYRHAAEVDPHGTGAGYFLGLALLRENRPEEARSMWQDTLTNAAPDAAGREQLAAVLARLEGALAPSQVPAQSPSPSPSPAPSQSASPAP